MQQTDLFRDTYLRYLGYTNEVGEAFRPLVPRSLVNGSYIIATGYCLADTLDKSIKSYKNGENSKKIAVTAGDVMLWQILASVVIPGFTINRITWLTRRAFQQANFKNDIKNYLPTIVGLASIPVIIKPIDHFVDYAMDRTIRKFF